MQERRAAIRVTCALPAAYSVTNRLSTLPARVTDLSMKGVRLWTGEPLMPGDQVTTSFLLPSEDRPLIVNGRVRWQGAEAGRSGGYQSGVEFGDVDETTQFCLQAFVTSSLQQVHRQAPAARPAEARPTLTRSQWLSIAAVIAGALAGLGLAGWIMAAERQKTLLRRDLADRSAKVMQLQTQQEQLQRSLSQEQASAADSRSEVQYLQAKRSELEYEIGWLNRNLADLKEVYLRVKTEREELRQQMADLQARFQSMPALRKAMRAAVQARQEAQQLAHRQLAARVKESDQLALEQGNRGYVMRAGLSTLSSTRLAVRVYTPEASADAGSP